MQLAVGENKTVNISRAVSFIEQAKQRGADIVALPECFNSPYGTGESFVMYFLLITNSRAIFKHVIKKSATSLWICLNWNELFTSSVSTAVPNNVCIQRVAYFRPDVIQMIIYITILRMYLRSMKLFLIRGILHELFRGPTTSRLQITVKKSLKMSGSYCNFKGLHMSRRPKIVGATRALLSRKLCIRFKSCVNIQSTILVYHHRSTVYTLKNKQIPIRIE